MPPLNRLLSILFILRTLSPVFGALQAVDDNFSGFANNLIAVATPGVLLNDQGSAGKVAVKIRSPQYGNFNLYENGAFFYMPPSNWAGEDSFTYRINDGGLLSNEATVKIVVKPFSQTIQFSLSSPRNLADSPITLNASVTSGYPITFKSSNPSVASISGQLLSLKAIGSTTITASQAGGGAYAAADPVSVELVVVPNPIDPRAMFPINFFRFGDHDENPIDGEAILTTVESVAALPLLTSGSIYYSSDAPFVGPYENAFSAFFDGSGGSMTRIALPSVFGAGVEAWVKSYDAQGDLCIVYNGAPGIDGWGLFQSNDTYQARLGATALSAPGGLANGDWHHLALIFSDGQAIFYVDGTATATSTFLPPLPTGKFVVGAVLSDPPSHAFFGLIDEVRFFSFGGIQFSQREFLPFSTNQTISFPAIDPKVVGDPLVNLNASASSGLSVSYRSSNTNVARVSGGNHLIISGPGTTTITARQRGDGQYVAARPVSQVFQVFTPPVLNIELQGSDLDIQFNFVPGKAPRVFSTREIVAPSVDWYFLGIADEGPASGEFHFRVPLPADTTQFFKIRLP